VDFLFKTSVEDEIGFGRDGDGDSRGEIEKLGVGKDLFESVLVIEAIGDVRGGNEFIVGVVEGEVELDGSTFFVGF